MHLLDQFIICFPLTRPFCVCATAQYQRSGHYSLARDTLLQKLAAEVGDLSALYNAEFSNDNLIWEAVATNFDARFSANNCRKRWRLLWERKAASKRQKTK